MWGSAGSLFLLPRVQEEADCLGRRPRAEEQEEWQEKKVLGNNKVQVRMRNTGEGTRGGQGIGMLWVCFRKNVVLGQCAEWLEGTGWR